MIGGIGDRAVAEAARAAWPLSCSGTDAHGRLADPLLRAQIAEFEVDEAAFRLHDGALRRACQGAPGAIRRSRRR